METCSAFPLCAKMAHNPSHKNPLSRGKQHPSRRPAGGVLFASIYLWGTCQMLSAYSRTDRSAAKMPLRAMLWRLMRFQRSRSA